MRGSGVAIDAAMFAALVGVHRIIGADIRTLNFVDNSFRKNFSVCCFDAELFFMQIKMCVILVRNVCLFQETISNLVLGATAFYGFIRRNGDEFFTNLRNVRRANNTVEK